MASSSSATNPNGSSKITGPASGQCPSSNNAGRRGSTPDTLAACRRPRTKEELRKCSPEELAAIKSGDEYTRRRSSLPVGSEALEPKPLHEALAEIKECRYLRGGTPEEDENESTVAP